MNADFNSLISQRFNDSIKVKQASLAQCQDAINNAGNLMADTLQSQHKILICGNGGSAADAQHFAAELIMRYETNRQSLAAIALTTDTSALTAIGNDLDYSQIFSRQIQGLGQAQDLLIAISTSGNSQNISNAITTAQQQNLNILVLSGNGGGNISNILQKHNVEIAIPSKITGRIQETHILIIHCLCEILDKLWET